MFQEITFSPFRTNVLDCIGRNDLVTEDGRQVKIRRQNADFVIEIDGQTYHTDDNVTASRILNNFPVGFKRNY